MDSICDCWLIDPSVARYGLTTTERRLKLMEAAEMVVANQVKKAQEVYESVRPLLSEISKNILVERAKDPRYSGEKFEELKKLTHYISREDALFKPALDAKTMCGYHMCYGINSTADGSNLEDAAQLTWAKARKGEVATCKACVEANDAAKVEHARSNVAKDEVAR